MPDATMIAADRGLYELVLVGGTAKTILVTSKDWREDGLIIQQISGTAPVYAKVGTSIAPKDSSSIMVVSGQYASIDDDSRLRTVTIAVVSASDAVISLYRNEEEK